MYNSEESLAQVIAWFFFCQRHHQLTYLIPCQWRSTDENSAMSINRIANFKHLQTYFNNFLNNAYFILKLKRPPMHETYSCINMRKEVDWCWPEWHFSSWVTPSNHWCNTVGARPLITAPLLQRLLIKQNSRINLLENLKCPQRVFSISLLKIISSIKKSSKCASIQKTHSCINRRKEIVRFALEWILSPLVNTKLLTRQTV